MDYDQRSGETAIYQVRARDQTVFLSMGATHALQIQGDNKGFALGVDGEKGNFDVRRRVWSDLIRSTSCSPTSTTRTATW